MRCVVCGKRFDIDKGCIYQVTKEEAIDPHGFLKKQLRIYDATDCPRCGCQKILGVRMPKVEKAGDQE